MTLNAPERRRPFEGRDIVLPVIGVVDDLVLVPLAIRWLLKRLPPEIAKAGQTQDKNPV